MGEDRDAGALLVTDVEVPKSVTRTHTLRANCSAILFAVAATILLPATADVIGPRPNYALDACLDFEQTSIDLSRRAGVVLNYLNTLVPSEPGPAWVFLEVRSSNEVNVNRDLGRVMYVKGKVQADKPNIQSVSAVLFHTPGREPERDQCPDGQVRLTFIVPKERVTAEVCKSAWASCRVECEGDVCQLRNKYP